MGVKNAKNLFTYENPPQYVTTWDRKRADRKRF